MTATTEQTLIPTEPAQIPVDKHGQPEQVYVRGICPECGNLLVSSPYYVSGSGYVFQWRCVMSLKQFVPVPTCGHVRVI